MLSSSCHQIGPGHLPLRLWPPMYPSILQLDNSINPTSVIKPPLFTKCLSYLNAKGRVRSYTGASQKNLDHSKVNFSNSIPNVKLILYTVVLISLHVEIQQGE